MKKENDNSQKKGSVSKDIKPEKDVLREPGQISFKDALKKAIVPSKKTKKS